MYKKIKASGSFAPFREESPKELYTTPSVEVLSLLALFREDLKKEKLQDLALLTLPTEMMNTLTETGRVIGELPASLCKEGCFYKTETNQILFVEKMVSKGPSIDLVEIKHIRGDLND